MEDFWKRAKSFADEAAKKSQTITTSTKISDLVSETAKRSREFAAEASKKADELKTAALKQADQIKSISVSEIVTIPPNLSNLVSSSASAAASSAASETSPEDLAKFGVSDDLRDFVKGLTSDTFKHFPIQDEAEEVADVAAATTNVRKDLSEWQERHATLVLTTVKEISRLRYELCPRVMKERRFWKIYFTLVSSHVAPYEKRYMEELKLKEEEKLKDDKAKLTPVVGEADKAEGSETNKSLASKSSVTEQDLDTFLLGDLEDSDGGQDDGNDNFDDDFDKIGDSDVDDENQVKK